MKILDVVPARRDLQSAHTCLKIGKSHATFGSVETLTADCIRKYLILFIADNEDVDCSEMTLLTIYQIARQLGLQLPDALHMEFMRYIPKFQYALTEKETSRVHHADKSMAIKEYNFAVEFCNAIFSVNDGIGKYAA